MATKKLKLSSNTKIFVIIAIILAAAIILGGMPQTAQFTKAAMVTKSATVTPSTAFTVDFSKLPAGFKYSGSQTATVKGILVTQYDFTDSCGTHFSIRYDNNNHILAGCDYWDCTIPVIEPK